jgi:hypothetical protein
MNVSTEYEFIQHRDMKFLTLLGYAIPTLAAPLVASPAWGFVVTMTPPSSLTLSGTNITTGTFQVNSATGFYIDDQGDVISETVLDTPVSFAATIGSSTTHTLFDADNKFLAIQYEGFFDPDNPGIANRDYHLTVGSINGDDNPGWTVFLPAVGGQNSYQVTNLGDPTTDPATETFTTDLPMLFASEVDALAEKAFFEELTNLNNSSAPSIFVGYGQASSIQFKPHGVGGAAVPEPLTILGSSAALAFGYVLRKKNNRQS